MRFSSIGMKEEKTETNTYGEIEGGKRERKIDRERERRRDRIQEISIPKLNASCLCASFCID